MIPKFLFKEEFTPAETFFLDKCIELLEPKTLDSHRARLHNPRSIIKELAHVLLDYQQKKIKSFDTVKMIADEAHQLLKVDNAMKFTDIDKDYYLLQLDKANEKEFLKLYFASNLVMKQNHNYCLILFESISSSIEELNEVYKASGMPNEDIYSKLKNLSSLINFFITELISVGYKKAYLKRYWTVQFNAKNKKSFSEGFNAIKDLCEIKYEKFEAIFMIDINMGYEDIHDELKTLFLTDNKIEEVKDINKNTRSFFSKRNHNTYFISLEHKAIDYLSVIDIAWSDLFKYFDLVHLGYSKPLFRRNPRVLIIGEIDKAKANSYPVNNLIDGNFKKGANLFGDLFSKFTSINRDDRITSETKNKLGSALRYLRLGSEAKEIEQKFLNYWIGLEYIFSNYDVDSSTFSRMKLFFVKSHALVYVSRNLYEFYEFLKIQVKEDSAVIEINDFTSFCTEEKLQHIMDFYFLKRPLVYFRAKTFLNLIRDRKERKAIHKKHINNLQWHLARAYRIRNEIVHDASMNSDIVLITSNLRYYLHFILGRLLEYFTDNPTDVNRDSKISIEDFFIMQELLYSNLDISGFSLEKMLNGNSSVHNLV